MLRPRPGPGEYAVLGIDPDTQGTGLALCTASTVLAVAVCPTLNGRKGLAAVRNQIVEMRRVIVALCSGAPVHAVVCETPQDYGEYRRKVNPNNLMLLSILSGAAIGIGGTFVPPEDCFVVSPATWKGQRSKAADNRITLDHYGWVYTQEGTGLPVPEIPDDVAILSDVPKVHLKEVVDAMGIAWWQARKRV